MDITVVGAGSLGSLLGGLLGRTHDVTLVGRDPHVAAVRERSLAVRGLAAFDVAVGARTDVTDLSGDLAVVTVKAYDTETAGRQLATGSFDATLSLQNGMGNEDALAEQLACPVLAGTASLGAVQSEPGVVEWTGRGDVVLGPWTGGMEPAQRVGEAFRMAEVPATVEERMAAHLWEKLAVNAAINPVTALAAVENGAVFAGPTAEIARETARETARVARAEGVALSEARAVDRAREVAEATAENRSSMYQDVRAGERTEIDAISGYVAARASAHDVSVPVTRTFAALVGGWETGQGLR